MFKLIILFVSFYVASSYRLNIREESPVLPIKNGLIQGTLERTRRIQKEYFAFRGIPYAKPPVGPLRFIAPVPIDNWEGILNTTEYKSECVQLFGFGGSEDCLYINVFTPDINAKDLPVMVWVHGGGFILGNSANYNPDYFLEEDVIVVALNYRFGIFGFLTTDDEVVPGNSGLKDQILALNWVQENIASFGGDPKQVTVFGESAGSVSVSYLLQTPLTTGLFRAAIMQSGTSLNLWSLSRDKKEAILALAKFLNITSTDSVGLVEGLREVDPHFLAFSCDAVESLAMAFDNPLNGLLYSPSVEPDLEGAVITGRSYEKLDNGEFQQVPTIIGLNSNEALMFMPAIIPIQVYFLQNQDQPNRFTPVDMNVNEEFFDEVGEQIYNAYFPNSMQNATWDELIRFVSEHQFDKGIQKTVELQSKHAPVYMYYFSYYESGTHLLPGAAHGDEMSYLWAEHEEDDHPLTKKMVKLWTNFAKTGNPTPEVDEVFDNIIWEQWGDNHKYLNINTEFHLSSEDVNERIGFWTELYAKYGNSPYDTY